MSRNGQAYYNEFDDYLCAWLSNLMDADLIAPGFIDSRSIKEVQPEDVRGYTQAHFFAGIGGWSLAARLAGWDDSRSLWTGSPPCQPFSTAGARQGTDDPRHLWPDLYRLIDAERPAVWLGEQVSGADGYGWLDGVGLDLEASRYAFRAVDIAACAVDSPQQRNRLVLAAVAMEIAAGQRGEVARDRDGFGPEGGGWSIDGRSRSDAPHASLALERADPERRREGEPESGSRTGRRRDAAAGADGQSALDHGERAGREGHGRHVGREAGWVEGSVRSASEADDRDREGPMGSASALGRGAGRPHDGGHDGAEPAAGDEIDRDPLADRNGIREHESQGGEREGWRWIGHRHGRNGSWWAGADWITCHDDKARRVADARAPLLVDGIRGNVAIPRPLGLDPARFPQEKALVSRAGAWGGFGNAIAPPLLAEAIGAMMDYLADIGAPA
jgi:DNA (cytosine-5)-methyltransferase 1